MTLWASPQRATEAISNPLAHPTSRKVPRAIDRLHDEAARFLPLLGGARVSGAHLLGRGPEVCRFDNRQHSSAPLVLRDLAACVRLLDRRQGVEAVLFGPLPIAIAHEGQPTSLSHARRFTSAWGSWSLRWWCGGVGGGGVGGRGGGRWRGRWRRRPTIRGRGGRRIARRVRRSRGGCSAGRGA